ncbi:nuclear fragile X mental retardation-interacting protein 2-like, partial [Clarias magur]
MHEKETVLSLNGETVLCPGYITNGFSSKPGAENDGSGSESGYTTPKKRRARRSSMKGTENTGRDKEKAAKPFFKQDSETSNQEVSGKTLHSLPNCTRTLLKPEMHKRPGVQDAGPRAEVQRGNSDSKTSISLVGKKTDDRVSKTKPVSSVNSKEDSWTLFKPPPAFPVDNSSAKIVPKISYASKVKENLNKATQLDAETLGKLSHVPMSAVKTVTSASLASVDTNGCYSIETSFSSAAALGAAPSSSNQAEEEEDAESATDNGCSSSSCSSAPEPRKSSLFVYPHKPLNMQPLAAQTNQKALGDIFQNQWGLSFINEPNAGPEGMSVSRPAAPFNLSDVTFQDIPFIHPSSAVSFPAPQDVQRRTNGTDGAVKQCSASRAAGQESQQTRVAHQEERENECTGLGASYQDLDADSTRSAEDLSQVHGVKEKRRSGARGWGWADFQAAVFYHTKEFDHLLTIHKQ